MHDLTTAHSIAWAAHYDRQRDYPADLFPDVPQALVDTVNTVAAAEGWALFDCDGSASGPLQIQRDEEEPVGLSDDMNAWMLVWSKANAGSGIHRDALLALAIGNQLEYLVIMGWVGSHQLPAHTDGPCNAAISTEGYWTCDSGPHRTPCGECRRLARGNEEQWDDDAGMFVHDSAFDGPQDDDWIHPAYMRQAELAETW